MTTLDSSPDAVAAASTDATTPGVKTPGVLDAIAERLTASDHKVIGRLFLGSGLLVLLATIVVNALIAFERLDGESVSLEAGALAQLFDAQRVGFVFGIVLPIGLGLSIGAVPLQLGARALAFARLAMLGYWMWLGGMVLMIVSLGLDGGTQGGEGDMVDLFILALALMAIGATAAAGSVATSVLTTRAPGMTMRRVPFFAWSSLVSALGIVLVMPTFLGTLIYLFVDHRNGRTAFGGNTGIAAWAGWLFTQPATILFAIPAVGLFVELLPVTFNKRMPARGVAFGGLALIGVVTFAAVTQQQVQSLPWSGSQLNLDDLDDKVGDLVPFALFNLVPLLGMLLVLVAALLLVKPDKEARSGEGARFNVTAQFVLGFFSFGMILVGMVGSVLYGIDDLGLQGTVFEEGVALFVVYGALLGFLGAIVHFAPKWWGATLGAAKVLPLAVAGLAATVLAAFPVYVAGFLDQPAGVDYADDDLVVWNGVSLAGHALMALTVLAFVGLLLSTIRRADGTADDPFGGQTIEWSTTSPAPTDNFVDVPLVHSAEPMLDLAEGNRS